LESNKLVKSVILRIGLFNGAARYGESQAASDTSAPAVGLFILRDSAISKYQFALIRVITWTRGDGH
jgi:hypothetical protein